MSQESAIEWTDATWNPVRGCTKVSPGCAHCYAETFAERFRGVPGHPYEQGFDLRLVPEKLTEPLKWKKPRRVFVNSMSDLFQDGVPDEYIDQVFAVMALAPQHTFQVLTKRADRMRSYFSESGDYTDQWYRRVFAGYRKLFDDGVFKMPSGYDEQYALGRSIGSITCGSHATRFLPNVWLGVSVENQHFADERIPLLLDTPAAVRFISAEPLLGPVDLQEFLPGFGWMHSEHPMIAPLSWVIVGGESGHRARPFAIEWADSIVRQCQLAEVPVFVKQLGAVPTMDESVWRATIDHGPTPILSVSNRLRAPVGTVALKLWSRSGGEMYEWPKELRVREFPA